MKVCPNCNGECKEDAKFCPLCGHNFADAVEEQPADVNQPEEMVDNTEEPQELQEVQEVESTDVVEEPSTSNRKSKIVFGTVAVVLVLAIALGVAFGKELFSSKKAPEDILMDAYKNMYQADTIHATAEFTFEEFDMDMGDPSVGMVTKMVEDLSFKMEYRYDKENFKFQADVDILLNDTSITTMQIYLDKKIATIEVPLVYDKPFIVTWEELFALINDKSGLDIDFESYVGLLDIDKYETFKDINFDNYEVIIKEFLAEQLEVEEKQSVEIGEKTVKLDKYALTYDMDKAMDFSFELIDEVLKDENVKAFIFEVIDTAADLVIENEDYPEYVTVDEIKASIEEAKDSYDEFVDELGGKGLLEYALSQEGMSEEDLDELFDMMDMEIEQDVYLDKDDNIKKVVVTETISQDVEGVSMDMEVKVDMNIESINEKIDFVNIDKSDAVDVLNMNEQELEELMYEIQGNVMSQMLTNPVFSQFLGGY